MRPSRGRHAAVTQCEGRATGRKRRGLLQRACEALGTALKENKHRPAVQQAPAVHPRARTPTQTHTRTHSHTRTHTRARAHTHTHTHTRTHNRHTTDARPPVCTCARSLPIAQVVDKVADAIQAAGFNVRPELVEVSGSSHLVPTGTAGRTRCAAPDGARHALQYVSVPCGRLHAARASHARPRRSAAPRPRPPVAARSLRRGESTAEYGNAQSPRVVPRKELGPQSASRRAIVIAIAIAIALRCARLRWRRRRC
jgi:hypothetical protein